jgi:hypothetical protein
MLGWVWSYFTFDVGVRLITETGTDQPAPTYPSQACRGKSAAFAIGVSCHRCFRADEVME